MKISVKYHKRGAYDYYCHLMHLQEWIDSKNDPHIDFNLYDSKRLSYLQWIGQLTLAKTKYGFWETHCEIFKDEDCNKGLGIRLYRIAINYAIRRGYAVRSSNCYSKEAKRLWRSKRLRQLFKIRKCGKRYRVYGKRSGIV